MLHKQGHYLGSLEWILTEDQGLSVWFESFQVCSTEFGRGKLSMVGNASSSDPQTCPKFVVWHYVAVACISIANEKS